MIDTPLPGPDVPFLKKWAFKVAARKIAVGLAGYLASAAVASWLSKYGITVNNAQFAQSAPALIFGALVLIYDWIKLKTGWEI